MTYVETKIFDSWSKYTYSIYSHTNSNFDWCYYGEINLRDFDRRLVGSEWQYTSFARIIFIVGDLLNYNYVYFQGGTDTKVGKKHLTDKDTWISNTKAYGLIGRSSSLILSSKFEELK